MEHARAAWTDARLDDLSRNVENGFNRLDADLRSLHGRVDSLHTRIDGLQRTIVQFGGALIVATLATLVSVLVQ
jgi:hypothetical protein